MRSAKFVVAHSGRLARSTEHGFVTECSMSQTLFPLSLPSGNGEKCADQIETSTPPFPGKSRAFDHFLCPGVGNLTFVLAGWRKLNRKCKDSNDFFGVRRSR